MEWQPPPRPAAGPAAMAHAAAAAQPDVRAWPHSAMRCDTCIIDFVTPCRAPLHARQVFQTTMIWHAAVQGTQVCSASARKVT